MKSTLVDVNVWIALAVKGHEHYHIAWSWLEGREADTALFCRVTQMGFLRVITGPQIAHSARDAWQLYQRLLSGEQVRYAAEPEQLESRWAAIVPDKPSGSTWTDAYLAAFAIEGDYQLVTFDRGFRNFPSLDVRVLAQ